MLFVATLRVTGGTAQERIARRAEWQYPAGTRLVAEYWLQGTDPAVITVFETDDNGAIFALTSAWSDVFDIDVVPAVTGEQGLALAAQMMGS
jgi:hypothetical protein